VKSAGLNFNRNVQMRASTEVEEPENEDDEDDFSEDSGELNSDSTG
jgi:hypothetical protein